MKLDAVLRAAQILRSQPAYTMPLTKLYARLAEELGTEAGSYAQVYQQLKKRPHSFMLVDSPRLLESGAWPAEAREDYDGALEGAGLGACVRVALTEVSLDEAPPAGAVTLAAATVNDLAKAGDEDAVIGDYIRRAAHQLEEISQALMKDAEAEHPTTPPPDPQR